ncbi:hypothetical protein [Actinoplanes sp. NPDC051851]|uniref:hypothetical protein n=1 Tax=Actinoplanes sp. NPDC051851 TaxID=3154753 RepID=UPI0034222021
MPNVSRTACRLVAVGLVVVASAAGCGSDDSGGGSAEPAVSLVSPKATPSPSLHNLKSPETGNIIVRLKDRTGSWNEEVGSADDTGSLLIAITCIGGGAVSVNYSDSAGDEGTTTPACNGIVAKNEDQDMADGKVKITIEPDGDQHWSAQIVRGAQ